MDEFELGFVVETLQPVKIVVLLLDLSYKKI